MKIYNYLMAFFRLNQKYICKMSKDVGPYDFHDYPDSSEGQPYHFELLSCKYCGKKFYI